MAILLPNLQSAKASKQKPTDGEIFLLEYLASRFDDDVTVYFQPWFNGDRPDVVLLSPNRGVIIVEVKDWNLELYSIDENNKWSVTAGGGTHRVKSPFAQVFAYKKNVFDIHVNGLLEKSLKNDAFYKLISTFVYFHTADGDTIADLYQPHLDRIRAEMRANERSFKTGEQSHDQYEKRRVFLERRRRQFDRDAGVSLWPDRLGKIMFPKLSSTVAVDEAVWCELKRLLNPPYHYASEGTPPRYSEQQLKLVQSVAGARAKICGLAGSGKTVVLAGRAVSAHKRHEGRVLILTFNITLGSYIHDRISAVREDFSWSSFEICNYHRFITSALNNAGMEIEVPEYLQYEGTNAAVARRVSRERNAYLEDRYYSNVNLFDGEEVPTYDTILIDEIQDYKPEWIKIIRSYFLSPGGEMILFGDEKQNIYQRELDADRRSKVVEGFGRWLKLTKSYRYASESPIVALVDAFQRAFLLENYTHDPDDAFQPSLVNVGLQAFARFNGKRLDEVARMIVGIAKGRQIHPNDISIISSQESVLRELDFLLRTGAEHAERTLCSFPPKEATDDPKYSRNYDKLSTAKKVGFNLNSGVVKLSSTHSFKGFESPLVFLIVNGGDSAEMVFTGLTRAKQDLVVLLEEGSQYQQFFAAHLTELEEHVVHASVRSVQATPA